MELIENKALKVTVPDEVAKEIKGAIHKTKELDPVIQQMVQGQQ